MVDLRFITSDNTMQKGATVLMIPAEEAITDVKAVMPVLFCKSQNPSCTDFMEVNSVVDDFIGRTMTKQQPLFCH
jgi:hypothetical protein